jgi:hypothetical protein
MGKRGATSVAAETAAKQPKSADPRAGLEFCPDRPEPPTDTITVKNFPIQAFPRDFRLQRGCNEFFVPWSYSGQVCGVHDVYIRGHGTLYSRDKTTSLTANFEQVQSIKYTAAPIGVGCLRRPDGSQLVGRFEDGHATGVFLEYDKTGAKIAEYRYSEGRRNGRSEVFGKEVGDYKNGERHGEWRFYHSDGSSYTGSYDADGKRDGEWEFLHPDGFCYTAVYEDDQEQLERRVHLKKPRQQPERKFVNATVESWRTQFPNATIATEHPVGGQSVDVMVKNNGVIALGEFKAHKESIPHAVGQIACYRGRLCRSDAEVAAARADGKLVSFVAVPMEPDAEDVMDAKQEAGVATWWPGQEVPF